MSKNTYQIDVFITAGKKCGSLDEMKREYEKMRELIDYQFFISESSYVLCDKDYIGRKQSDMLSIYFSKIVTCAKLKDYAGIKKEFEKAFLYIDKNKGFSSIYVKYNFSDIIRKVCECLKTEEHLVDVVEKIYETRSMEEMKMVILQFVGQLEMQETEVPDNRLVFLAKQIVSEKYQDISLGVSMIADELHVSLPYLSTLFKMETGQTLVKYVTSYRMEQARLLLENSNMKIADVAERVGYLNTSYFISLFRNREGCSPQQYREKKFNHEEA